MHFKSIATFLAKSANEKKSVRSTKGGICGVRTQRRSHHHHMYTGHVDVETSGCGHATFGFRRAPATAWTWWCILANKGFANLAIVTKFSPLTVRQRQNDDLQFCLPCEKCEWWGRRERAPVNFLKESFADEDTCRDWYRTEHAGWWLDQRVAILGDQPLCSDELDDQLSSLLCQLIHQQ